MRRTAVYLPSNGPADWQRLLAEPTKQWRTGYSARTLAHAWEQAGGVPPEVARLFDAPPELLLALPEHKGPFPEAIVTVRTICLPCCGLASERSR